jgi:hypothetical protein
MANNRKQSNILLCGSSRVGKSTLINAICQQKLAKSSASLNSLTERIDRYSYEYSNGQTIHETIIWDTPGIESWDENEVRNYMASLIEQTQPLCMIYCASPGSFAVLNHVAWLVSECHRKNIFCALVCTNMWAGRNRKEIVDEFCRILNTVHPKIRPNKEDNIIYYDHVALVTMVNSQEYTDKDFGVIKPPSGVEELIFGIAKCLNRDLMFAWFRSVAQNTSFWTKMSSKLSNLLKVPTETFTSLYGHAATFLDYLLESLDPAAEYNMPMTHDNTLFTTRDTVNIDWKNFIPRQCFSFFLFQEESIFHDAEMIDMPEQVHPKKLTFTFKSAGEKFKNTKDMTYSLIFR